MDIQGIFSRLPTYKIEQVEEEERQGIFNKVREWLFGKQRKRAEEPPKEVASSLLMSFSGRTLRQPRMWHVNWELLRRFQFQPVVFSIIGSAIRTVGGVSWAIQVNRTTPAVSRKAAELEALFGRPVPGPEGQTFTEWIRLLMRDLLVFDACAIEVIKSQDGEVVALKPVPGWQIEAAAIPDTNDLDPEQPYIRVHRGAVVARYKPNELIYFKENTRTDSPYGISPLEAAITLVSLLVWADAFQLKGLAVTEVPEGILDLGQVPPSEVDRFRQYWLAEVVGRPDKVVITNSGPQGLRWIPFRSDNRALQFRQVYDLYIRLLCACFGVRPSDIGFVEGAPSRATAEEWTMAAKRSGIYPRLKLIEDVINYDILEKVIGVELTDLRFKFLDLERRDMVQTASMVRTLVPTIMTINEAREMLGLPKVVGGVADCLYQPAGMASVILAYNPPEGTPPAEIDRWKRQVPSAPGMYQGGAPEMGGGGLGGLFGLFGKSVMPFEKVLTAVEAACTSFEKDEHKLAFIEKAMWKHLSFRLPYREVKVTLFGRQPETYEDYVTLFEKIGEVERVHGYSALWEAIFQVAVDIAARSVSLDVTSEGVTVTLAGKVGTQVLTFKAEE